MMRSLSLFATAATLLAALSIGVAAQGTQQTQQKQVPTVTRTGAPYTSPASGAEMFESYCVSCHGKDGKGHGPAAAALKTPLPDLTQLAASHGGKFPKDEILQSVKSHSETSDPRDMPCWGRVFQETGGEAIATLRVHNLVSYLESIQQK